MDVRCLFGHAWTRAHILVQMFESRRDYLDALGLHLWGSRLSEYLPLGVHGGVAYRYRKCRWCKTHQPLPMEEAAWGRDRIRFMPASGRAIFEDALSSPRGPNTGGPTWASRRQLLSSPTTTWCPRSAT